MIKFTTGNMLTTDVEALVNTVNTQGVMGKGIALQFKKAFPDMFKVYLDACKAGKVFTGQMHVVTLNSIVNPRYIINFPTKQDWRRPSQMLYIESGLQDLVRLVRELGISSIAVPPLGCGNGGLPWSLVQPKIEAAFSELPKVRVLLFAPHGAPDADKMLNRTARPPMTLSRAVVLKLLQQYCVLGYELTLLEVQKLLYFMQEFGEPLRLRFEKKYYGPYADNLRHVLNLFEGHFTSGFADGNNKPDTVIRLLPRAVEEASDYIMLNHGEDNDHVERLKQVAALIEGFESPYGMELLSSVHWLIKHEQVSPNFITDAVKEWNPRKAKLMKPKHIEIAWQRLCSTDKTGENPKQMKYIPWWADPQRENAAK